MRFSFGLRIAVMRYFSNSHLLYHGVLYLTKTFTVEMLYRMRLNFAGLKFRRRQICTILADLIFADEGVVHILYCMYTL